MIAYLRGWSCSFKDGKNPADCFTHKQYECIFYQTVHVKRAKMEAGERPASVVKNTGCLSRGPGLNTQPQEAAHCDSSSGGSDDLF